MQRKVVKASDIEALIDPLNGNVTAIARQLGCSRQTVYKKVNASASLQDKLSSARETMLDMAESALYRQVLEGNMTAIIFFLKTQGKRRGYIERIENELSTGDGSVAVQIYLPDNGRSDKG